MARNLAHICDESVNFACFIGVFEIFFLECSNLWMITIYVKKKLSPNDVHRVYIQFNIE
jgi:hypothetical protein